MRKPVAAFAFVVTAALVVGCRRVPAPITAVRIEAQFGKAHGFDHLAFSLRPVAGGSTLDPPVVFPRADGGVALEGPQSLVVYVDDSLAGVPVTCTVAGLRDGGTI